MRRFVVSPELAAWLIFLCLCPILLRLPVTNDSAWQMWLGRQMLHGSNLYTDLIEVNPPLWFWISVPLAWISEIAGQPSRIVLTGFLILILAGSLALCTAMIVRWEPKRRACFLTAFLIATIAIALPVFTQREHFVLVVTIPYVLLCGVREEGEKVRGWLAAAIGVAAAFGFALKPFFILVPIALELWLWRKAPRARPETVSLGMLAILYFALVAIFERDFLASVPMISASYRYFIGNNYNGFLIPLVLFALAYVPIAKGKGAAIGFAVAALAYLLTFFLQGKAWSYQALPALGMLVVALALLPLGRSAVRDGFALAIVATAIILNARVYRTDRPFLFPVGSSVATLAVTTQPNWPQVEERGYRWPLHAFSLWQLGAIDNGVLPAAPLQRRVAHDLACHPPDFLLIDRVEPVRRFLRESPELLKILSHYRAEITHKGMTLYRRKSSLTARPSGCRPVYSAAVQR